MRDSSKMASGTGGYRYEGQWVADAITGHGTARFADKSVYIGASRNGKPWGCGQITYTNGGTYHGD